MNESFDNGEEKEEKQSFEKYILIYNDEIRKLFLKRLMK